MASTSKEAKLDCKNRVFNNDWTLKYLFISPTLPNSKPMCLICNECVSVLSSVDEGSLQLELVDIQSSSALKEDLQEGGAVKFWSERIQQQQFPNARKVAICMLTMFGSTFTCESSFSSMNAIKTNSRSLLSNERLQDCMRIALTSHQPNFIKIAQKRKCNFSH